MDKLGGYWTKAGKSDGQCVALATGWANAAGGCVNRYERPSRWRGGAKEEVYELFGATDRQAVTWVKKFDDGGAFGVR